MSGFDVESAREEAESDVRSDWKRLIHYACDEVEALREKLAAAQKQSDAAIANQAIERNRATAAEARAKELTRLYKVCAALEAAEARAAKLREHLEAIASPCDPSDFGWWTREARRALAADSVTSCEHAWLYERTAQQEEYQVCKACGKVADSATQPRSNPIEKL